MSNGINKQALETNDIIEHNKIKKRRNPSRFNRKIKIFLFYTLILFLVVGGGIFISFTLLFKIETIGVEGETRYDKSEIIKLSGVKKGENLFLSKTKSGEDAIEKSLPYIGSAVISKKIPNGIIINVSETYPDAQIESKEGYIVINLEGKVIDIVSNPVENVCIVKSASLKDPVIGNKIEFYDEGNKVLFENLLNEVRNCDISNVKVIDLSNPMHIFLDYDNRIKIELGSPDDANYKLRTAAVILRDELQQNDRGKLDVSLSVQNNKTYFTPDYLV